MSFPQASMVSTKAGLGIQYRLLVVSYVATVVLFSYRENLTFVAKVIGVMLGLAFVLLSMGRRHKFVIPRTYRIWGIWFLFALASSVMTASTLGLAITKALTLVQVAVVGFLITNFLIWNRSTRFYVMGLIGATLISSLMVLSDPGRFATSDGRVFGTLENSNTFGTLLSSAFVLALVSALSSSRIRIKAVLFAVVSVIFTMLLRTGSRKAMIAGVLLGGGLIVLAWLYKSKAASGRSFLIALIAVTVIMPIGIHYITSSDFWFRIENIQEAYRGDMTDVDSSLVGRLWLARKAIETAAEYPVFGIGLDNFRTVSDSVTGRRVGVYTHSNYLEIMVGTGAIGFVLYFSMYWLWLRKLYAFREMMREPDRFGRYVMVMVVVLIFVAMDIAMVSYADKVFWLILPWVVAELHLLEVEHRQCAGGRRHVTGQSSGRKDPVRLKVRTAKSHDA